MVWIDKGEYWLSDNKQGTDEWLKDRMGKVTMSKISECARNCKFWKDEDLPKLVDIMKGNTKEVFTEKSISNMKHGIKYESIARDKFAKDYDLEIIERGLIVPKFNKYIGASVDGEIVDGDAIIEIKCPPSGIYPELLYHGERLEKGFKPNKYYHEHIKIYHYDQMQGCMAVLKKKKCYYIVYDANIDDYVFDVVYFNKKYWEEDLYPKTCKFIDKYLKN